MNASMRVNGVERAADVEPRVLLVDFLRTNLALTGTHVGCDTTSCGACTVLLDGEPVKSCTLLAVQVAGRDITTVEGLAQGATLSPVQVGFHEEHGLQCGFCTPGMMLVGTALLERNADPTEEQIRWRRTQNPGLRRKRGQRRWGIPQCSHCCAFHKGGTDFSLCNSLRRLQRQHRIRSRRITHEAAGIR